METPREYNNHILTDQERRQLTIIADETIQTFAESIDGMHQVMQEFPPSQNQEFNHIMDTLNDVSTFISYSFGDCIVLTKYFINTQISYEKSFLRGILNSRHSTPDKPTPSENLRASGRSAPETAAPPRQVQSQTTKQQYEYPS